MNLALKVLENTPCGYKLPQDELFAIANEHLLVKYKELGIIHRPAEWQEKLKSTTPVGGITCQIMDCLKRFENVREYQTHYDCQHRYVCHICRRTLVTAHLLDLHISEMHDSYFAVLAERGQATYSCLLQECDKVMKSAAERKKHCMKEHKFPANFQYGLYEKKKKSEEKTKTGKDVSEEEMPAEDAMELDGDIVNDTKAFSFGMPKEKMFDRRSKKSFNLKDLEQALPKTE